ncbi:MAG: hypothetical protein ACOC8E_05110 [Planctomycetota bacterium]
MRKPSQAEVLTQLLDAYRQEARLYAGIERAAIEQFDILQNGRDPARLAELTERQRTLSELIGKIESGIQPVRQHWEQVRDSLEGPRCRRLASQLDRLLDRLADQIHTVVEIERENSNALFTEAIGGVPE